MSKVENINPEKVPIPASWVPRVVRGGKDGDPPDTPVGNWLEDFEVGTVFIASPRGSLYGNLFEVIYKGEVFILLHQSQGGVISDIYVYPPLWCNTYKDYEVLGINPPDRGGNNEQQRDPC